MYDHYQAIFNQRGELYNRANRALPQARCHERSLLLDRLAFDRSHRVCDVPAGGGYVADGLRERGLPATQIVCIEPSPVFAGGIAARYPTVIGQLQRLPVASASMDRVVSLAGIHHLADKAPFFQEVWRILRPGTLFTIADVQQGSPAARFLNGAVDRLSETGHRGIFPASRELTRLLALARFQPLREEHLILSWNFPDDTAMVGYCRDLFGMTRGSLTQVREAIFETLPVQRHAAQGTSLEWSLVYAVGRKP